MNPFGDIAARGQQDQRDITSKSFRGSKGWIGLEGQLVRAATELNHFGEEALVAAGKAATRGAGAFHNDPLQGAEALHSRRKVAVAGWVRRDAAGADKPCGYIDYGCDVVVLVGVDTTRDSEL